MSTPQQPSPAPTDPIPKSTHHQHLQTCISLARLSPPKPTNFRVGAVIVSYPTSHSTTSDSESTHHRQDEKDVHGAVLATGYTLELPGNTHAEQNALSKLLRAQARDQLTQETDTRAGLEDSTREGEEGYLSTLFPPDPHRIIVLYTSLEPCSVRLSGNTPCVQRIISTCSSRAAHTSTSTNPVAVPESSPRSGISKVVFGAKEPGTFVRDSQSCRILSEAEVEWEYIPEFEEEILRVAMTGHVDRGGSVGEEGSGKRNEKGDGRETEDLRKEGGKEKEKRIDDITEEERRRQDAQPRNPKKRMMELDPRAG